LLKISESDDANKALNFVFINIEDFIFKNCFIMSKIDIVCTVKKKENYIATSEHQNLFFSHLFVISNYLKENVRKL
jgi:hypothetical protein